MKTKRCPKCKKNKPLSEFYINSNNSIRGYCKVCGYKRIKKRRKDNPEEYKENQRNRNLERKYNITMDQYNDLYIEQSGKCKICGIHVKDLKRRLDVDHDHETGEIRGLLCWNCNLGIGNFNDDPELTLKATEYLKLYHEKGS